MMQLRQFLRKINTKDHNQQKSNKKIDGWNHCKGDKKGRPKDAQLVETKKKGEN